MLGILLTHLTYEELEAIHDVGPATAGSIVYYFEENEDMIMKLLREVHPKVPLSTKANEADG